LRVTRTYSSRRAAATDDAPIQGRRQCGRPRGVKQRANRV
jgi:hypothetical protein